LAGYGLSRVPTGFIPIEDQGYLLARGAIARRPPALDRHPSGVASIPSAEMAGKAAGVEQVISIAGISAPRQQFEPSPNAGVCLSDPQGLERGAGPARICGRWSSASTKKLGAIPPERRGSL